MRKTTFLKLLAIFLFLVSALSLPSEKAAAAGEADLSRTDGDAEGKGWHWVQTEQTLYLYGTEMDSLTLPAGASVNLLGYNRINGSVRSSRGGRLSLSGSGVLEADGLGSGTEKIELESGTLILHRLFAETVSVQGGYLKVTGSGMEAAIQAEREFSQSAGYVSAGNSDGAALVCDELRITGGYLECVSDSGSDSTAAAERLTQQGGVLCLKNSAEGCAFSGGTFLISSGVSVVEGGARAARCRIQTQSGEKLWFSMAPEGPGAVEADAVAADYGSFVAAKNVTGPDTDGSSFMKADSLYYAGSDILYLDNALVTGGLYAASAVECRIQLFGEGTVVAARGLLFDGFDNVGTGFSGTAVGCCDGSLLNAGITFENEYDCSTILSSGASYIGVGFGSAGRGIYAEEGLTVLDAELAGVGNGSETGGVYAVKLSLERKSCVTAYADAAFALDGFDFYLNGGSLSAVSREERAVHGKVYPGADQESQIGIYGGTYAAYDDMVFAEGTVSGKVYKGMTGLGEDPYTYTADEIRQVLNTKVIYGIRRTPVSGVMMNKTKAELFGIGEELQLQAEVLPAGADNRKLYWMSTAPSVVKIDQKGLATAVGEGVAEIVAESEDGGFSAVCTITVRVPKYTVTVQGGHTMDEFGIVKTEYAEGEVVTLVLDEDRSSKDCSFGGWYSEEGMVIIDSANNAYSAWFEMPAYKLNICCSWKIEQISITGYKEAAAGETPWTGVRLAQDPSILTIESADWVKKGSEEAVRGSFSGGEAYSLRIRLQAGEGMSFGARLNQAITLNERKVLLQEKSSLSADGKTAVLYFEPVELSGTPESAADTTKASESTGSSEGSTEDGGESSFSFGKLLPYVLFGLGAALISFGIGFLIGRSGDEEDGKTAREKKETEV